MATNELEVYKNTNQLEVVYDWASVGHIWEDWFERKISMREREESLAYHRNKLHADMLRRDHERGK